MGYLPSGTKLTIVNYIYTRGTKPGERMVAHTYEGKNVMRLKEFVPKLVKTIFNPTTWQQKETEVKEGKYSSIWHVFKDLDYYSYLRFDLKIKISYKGNEGKASIELGDPVVVTEYPQETYWQRTFIYEIFRVLWHNLFYRKKLEGYMDWSRTKVSTFVERLQSYFEKLEK